MNINKKSLRKAIIIVFISICFVTFLYMMVTRVQLFAGKKFYIKFEHVGSLAAGAVVRTAGVRIGTVSDIKLNEADFRTVIVTGSLYSNQDIRRGSRCIIMSGSLIGDQYVEVIPSQYPEFIADGEMLYGEPLKNLDSFLLSSDTLMKDFTTVMSTLAEILTENKDNVNMTLLNVRESSDAIKKYFAGGPGQTPGMEQLSHLLESLDKAVSSIAIITESLSSSDSVVGVLSRKESSADLAQTITNLKKISESLVSITRDLETIMGDIVPAQKSTGVPPKNANP
ncbi:MAG: MCE family protein [Spirochaetaceae bacterium]|nr:MAG: MCE family protein [Spirochaetaceae bacterium]